MYKKQFQSALINVHYSLKYPKNMLRQEKAGFVKHAIKNNDFNITQIFHWGLQVKDEKNDK